MEYPMDDNSIMPFGRYQGAKLIDVPAQYLKYLHNNEICKGSLKAYIEDNMQVIDQDIQKFSKYNGADKY